MWPFFLQHPGSDEAVWKSAERAQRLHVIERAANVKNFILRVQDVSAVLDQLEAWNASHTNALAGRFDLRNIGMAGHSFGAMTAEAVGAPNPSRGQRRRHRQTHHRRHRHEPRHPAQ